MTLYRITHRNLTVSETYSNRSIRYGLVVHTAAAQRRQILDRAVMQHRLLLDNLDRALTDGTGNLRNGVMYTGGLEGTLTELEDQYDLALASYRYLLGSLEVTQDLYQVVGWFEDSELVHADHKVDLLREEYELQDVYREVYIIEAKKINDTEEN